MILLYTHYPFALIEDDNGDFFFAREHEEFNPIRIPVGWGCMENLSLKSIKEMTYQVCPDTNDVTLPADQYEDAVDLVIRSEHSYDSGDIDAVKEALYEIVRYDLEVVHDKAVAQVRKYDMASIPELLDKFSDNTYEEITLDSAAEYVWQHVNVLNYDEVRHCLETDYKHWFENPEEKEFIVDMSANLLHTIRMRAADATLAREAACKLIDSGKLYLEDCFSDNLKDCGSFDIIVKENSRGFDDYEVFSAKEILKDELHQ